MSVGKYLNYLTMNEKLKYNGESYKWSGTLNDLKRFVN